MFQEWIEEYVAFEKKLTEVIKKNKGDVKNAYALISVEFNPQTLTLVNGEGALVSAEINYIADEEITEISFRLMRKLIDDGYMEYKHSKDGLFFYIFHIENFIDFEEALEE